MTKNAEGIISRLKNFAVIELQVLGLKLRIRYEFYKLKYQQLITRIRSFLMR